MRQHQISLKKEVSPPSNLSDPTSLIASAVTYIPDLGDIPVHQAINPNAEVTVSDLTSAHLGNYHLTLGARTSAYKRFAAVLSLPADVLDTGRLMMGQVRPK